MPLLPNIRKITIESKEDEERKDVNENENGKISKDGEVE